MRYFPQRARQKQHISLLLKVCPDCLGDLVHRSDYSGDYYLCMQCNERVDAWSKKTSAPRPVTLPREFFPGAEPTLT
jgi:hypothetical protein